MTISLPLLAAGLAAAAALGLLTLWRPALGCVLLAVAVPLTGGLGRGAVVPLLRANEVLLLVVVGALVVRWLPRRRALAFGGLDLAVLAFTVGITLIPWAVLLLGRAEASLELWQTVIAPLQYLLVYLVFSRTELSDLDLRLVLNVSMLASVVIAVVAVAQVASPSVRALISAYYPEQVVQTGDVVYRPASLLGHYSALGAFGVLNFVLALALAAVRHRRFSGLWLALVMEANVVALIASQTWAPILALPVAILIVLLLTRHVPWQLAAAPAALGAAAIVLWPQVSGRLQQQLVGSGGGGMALPETLQTRLTYWQDFFLPALLKHGPWFGTGTVIPSEVPRPLVDFVDNEYLWTAFRAGIPGVLLLLLVFTAVAAAGWAASRSEVPLRKALGTVCVAAVAALVLVGATSEYLTFTAVSQEFWMLVGMTAGLAAAARRATSATVISPPSGGWRAALLVGELWRRVRPERLLLRSSAVVLGGFSVARLLGFLFAVAAGRILAPADFGRMTYALTVVAVASVLLTSAPVGLSRFLSRHAGERAEQDAYYTNWLALVGLVLLVSLAVAVPVAVGIGLGGWMLLGLAANLLGVAALETYREVQRGLGRYAAQAVFYVLANLLQLAAIAAAGALGWGSPALFVTVYGLSSLVALAIMALVAPIGVSLGRGALRRERLGDVARFIRPVLLQSVFYGVWIGADLILVQHLRSPLETGQYAAAKAITNGLLLVPTAVSFVLLPRVAQLPAAGVAGYLLRALGLTALVSLPPVVFVTAFGGPLLGAVFGPGYVAAAAPLAVLAGGMAVFGLYLVIGSLWVGVGHPVVDTVASGAAMVTTVGSGVLLTPAWGPSGAAAAFGLGALVALAVTGSSAAWVLGARRARRGEAAMAAGATAVPGTVSR
jgi:O-antigen/teichoic acid export membrane protein